MDKPTSRIFFSFPVMLSRVICKGFLSDNVLTAYLAEVGKRHPSLPYQWILICNFNRVWSKYFTPNRSQLGAQLKPSWCPLLVCFLLLFFHSIQPRAIKTLIHVETEDNSEADPMPKEQVEGVLSVISKEARENYESLNKAVSTQNSNIIRGGTVPQNRGGWAQVFG